MPIDSPRERKSIVLPVDGMQTSGVEPVIPETELIEVPFYPEERDEEEDNIGAEVENLVEAARLAAEALPVAGDPAQGYVSNARNAASRSDEFPFWAPAEQTAFGVGILVRHSATDTAIEQPVDTYGIIIAADAQTLGLEDFAIHVYEEDARPPLESIQPAPSKRRPVVNYKARVIASTCPAYRPVLSGPVRALKAAELAAVHGQTAPDWPGQMHMLLGLYEDDTGDYGVLAEERVRVLGPKQGHVIFSGLPGAGKTSLFLTLVISLYAQLQGLEPANDSSGQPVPGVATIAFNVKGADLLFPDHLDHSDLSDQDRRMWAAAGVDATRDPFCRVIVYVPLADDGLNRHTLRSNSAADRKGYSETIEFALGISDLWPYLGLFFDNRSGPARDLLAEIEEYFEEVNQGQGFTFAEVMELFKSKINRPLQERKSDRWESFTAGTVRAVWQRLKSLPATLGGLIDLTGKGFGLDRLTDLRPYDMVVIDFERIMANPSDPEIAENAIKVITAYVLSRLTEAMTSGKRSVDNVIVFADELNRLAPRSGSSGIGEYLAQLARTTRDRGVVLFGAGQFRSGINEDILKAASVHYSMQTPDYELDDRIYASLAPEIKARLTRLKPGETLLQYPSLRTAVFARFPRPFVFTGATRWRETLEPQEPRSLAECIHERLRRLAPDQPPALDEVGHLLARLDTWEKRPEVVQVLRDIEMEHHTARGRNQETPWQQFAAKIRSRYQSMSHSSASTGSSRSPRGFDNNLEGWHE